MADFPSGPGLTVGQLFTSGWSTWMWDGVKWMASMPSGGVYEPVFGGTQYPMYGFLYNKTVGDPGYSTWAGFGAHRWRFGTNPGDQQDAGAIDYRGYVSDALSIVGAGTLAGSRKINLYDNVNVSGNLTVGSTQILGGGGISSVGNISSTGSFSNAGPISTTGSNAIFQFQDRTTGTMWGWYASGGIARLWNNASGDRVTFDSGGSIATPGSLRTGASIFMGGPTLYFSGVSSGGPYVSADLTNMTAQLGSGNGGFYWYNNPGTQLANLNSGGSLFTAGSLFPGSGTAGDAAVELGQGRTGTGNSYVDFHSQAGTDFDFRIIRLPGPNGQAQIVNNGSGGIAFQSPAAVTFNSTISTTGALSAFSLTVQQNLTFLDQGSSNYWTWYGSGSVARLYFGGDRFTVDTGGSGYFLGNLLIGGSVRIQGGGDWGGSTTFGSFTSRVLRFQINSGDEANAGYIGYRTFDGGALCINGAGVGGSRWVHVWDHLKVDNYCNVLGSMDVGGSFSASGGQIVCYNSNQNGFYVANANGHYLRIYDDTQGHIEVQNGTLYINYVTGSQVYMGGYLNVGDFGSRGNVYATGGSILMSGNYLYFQNTHFASVNGSGGPFIYGDGNYIIAKLGNGSGGFAVRNYGAGTLFTVGNNGDISNAGWIYANNVVTPTIYLANTGLLYGKDTGGTPRWIVSLWNDNNIYLGNNERLIYIRSSGRIYCNNEVYSTGGSAGMIFQDRNGGFDWQWYATGSVARLWSSADGDRVTIDRGGNISTGGIFTAWDVHCSSGLFVNGLLFTNNGGWWWTGSPIHTDSDMQCANITTQGSFFCHGVQWWNNGGWWWTPNPVHTDSAIQCNDFYVGGCRMYNNSGYMYFDQTLHAAGVYSRGDIWNAGNITAGNGLVANGGGWSVYAPNGGIYTPNECHGGYVSSSGDMRCNGNAWAGNDMTAYGVYRSGGNGGARIGNWAGSGWDWMAFAIISGGYLGVSPDQGASGFNYTPNASWSDARLKLNIRDSEIDALAVIGAISVRAFEWTEEGRKLMPRKVSSVSCGFVAQELEELIPDAVTIVPVIGDLASEGMRCILDEQLTPYLFRAMQQLAARVEELEDLVRNLSQRSLT
jgi:hypothetical protein